MAVTVQIINKVINEVCSECQAALLMKKYLEESFTNSIQGKIYIAYGLTLCGQEVRDIDLLVTGHLQNYKIPAYYSNGEAFPKKALIVDNFCYVIELKEHTSDKVLKHNTHIYVEYEGEYKDATEQNERQRYSFLKYFNNLVGYKPFVCNALWLKSIDSISFNELKDTNPIGALPSKFSFKDLIDLYIVQGGNPYYNQADGAYHISAVPPTNGKRFIQDVKTKVFSEKRLPVGQTKKKLDLLQQKELNEEVEKTAIGKKLTIFAGRAGAGKTFKLIVSALHLANNVTGKRALLLTYNHALVGDIRHMLEYLDIPDAVDNYTVQVQTLQRFFIQLMDAFGINYEDYEGDSFEERYYRALNELNTFVKETVTKKDLKCLKDDNKSTIDWDYILIDEGQDWHNVEKELLFNIYGVTRIIVADGIDQFNRSNPKQIWGEGIDDDNIDLRKESRGLRQKSNLNLFVNALASELNLNQWKVRLNNEFIGGRVIIRKEYDNILHKDLVDYNAKCGCENYDILFLCTHQMTVKDKQDYHHFAKLDSWKQNGIVLFDGTNEQLRSQYSTNPAECRLYQYESCRGLEGWCTICMHFDELMDNKVREYTEYRDQNVVPNTIEKEAYLWSLIPLTRPVDTLVITVKNPDSKIAKIFQKLAGKFDFVDCQL